MEPENDPQLRKLLKEWEVGNAPKHLDRRVLGEPNRGWRFWLQGSIRIPVPVGLAVVALLMLLTGLLLSEQKPDGSNFNLANFQPVANVNVQVLGGESVQ